ncbi:LytR/AlgR family response regulator transcription factor [Alteribacter natronophilus]|uniref:LytR/AlgR family response regulator transcription factor n=1 Tax=Alteribacter natronophilus TaxID=2583810 RepID=UPI00110E5A79|nr:LytTR family DNA-binding domain-containing protein [Alteribacter natronophilus]TMW72902.1 response regulator transcription factor [Alteribacter natronophilus]
MSTETIRTIIVDDEPNSRDELRFLLGSFSGVHVIEEAGSAEKALELIVRHEPDLVFLDIEMPGMSGMDLAASLKKLKQIPLIVFATAYPDYAAKAFRVQALDYLLKPFDEEDLAETMNLVKARLREKNENSETRISQGRTGRLPVDDHGRIVYVVPEDISYFYREERETVICTPAREYRSKMPMKDLEDKLKPYRFFRTHKSYMVNLDHVAELIPWMNGAYQVKVEGRSEEIPVSRNYVKALREQLEL